MSQLIQEYLLSIERKLDFDSGLALRAREDVEEYLHEFAADRHLGAQDAVQLAIAGFGDSDSVARQYAASGLGRQISQTWLTLILAMAGAFAAMRLRAMTFGVEVNELFSALLWLDRFALATCLCFAAIGRLGFSFRLPLQVCSPRTAFRIAMLAIACSVAFGLSRAALANAVNLTGWPALIVIATAAAEIIAVAFVGIRVRKMDRYFFRASAAG
ncbi:hypothetical protein [Porphyrobacter sp. CACIAM 03H1]|uniref:hypothetical protein n=1 Tax=Porphyrobacter sp. CACIAM 03H1 TaxID=2003315 RepID=UPI000B5A8076|nr:hypothetical protein [Porphyrobacter sp. CACIAM 03H1]ASJ91932.1 hypothetical protein CBR61_14040 [Porphyrobacter sp. CACIAM 03H1]